MNSRRNADKGDFSAQNHLFGPEKQTFQLNKVTFSAYTPCLGIPPYKRMKGHLGISEDIFSDYL
jgi:hypothetical protein